jgi:hypothetical protein
MHSILQSFQQAFSLLGQDILDIQLAPILNFISLKMVQEVSKFFSLELCWMDANSSW